MDTWLWTCFFIGCVQERDLNLFISGCYYRKFHYRNALSTITENVILASFCSSDLMIIRHRVMDIRHHIMVIRHHAMDIRHHVMDIRHHEMAIHYHIMDNLRNGTMLLTLCYWPIYIWEREREEEVGSGDPTSLPWPI